MRAFGVKVLELICFFLVTDLKVYCTFHASMMLKSFCYEGPIPKAVQEFAEQRIQGFNVIKDLCLESDGIKWEKDPGFHDKFVGPVGSLVFVVFEDCEPVGFCSGRLCTNERLKTKLENCVWLENVAVKSQVDLPRMLTSIFNWLRIHQCATVYMVCDWTDGCDVEIIR